MNENIRNNSIDNRITNEHISELIKNVLLKNKLDGKVAVLNIRKDINQKDILINTSKGDYVFAIDLKNNICYEGNIAVHHNARGKGMGRKLVEINEEVCKHLKIKYNIITNNTNSEFWKYMGYISITKEIEELLQMHKIEYNNNSVYKNI